MKFCDFIVFYKPFVSLVSSRRDLFLAVRRGHQPLRTGAQKDRREASARRRHPVETGAARLSQRAITGGARNYSRTTPMSLNGFGSTGGITLSFNAHCQKPTSIQRPCL